MVKVRFYDEVEDSLLKFAVMIARHDGKWVFCKHRKRETYEVPGGHREPGEKIDETAGREGEETYGMLYTAEIRKFEKELHSEIEKILITKDLPEKWTYPEIQPVLMREAKIRRGGYHDE